MDIALLLTLAGLALVDSTSYGTFVIPLVLIVVQRRVQVRPLSWYFLTVVGFYFLIGVLLTLGLDVFIDVLTDIRTSPAGTVIQLLIGGGLLLLSFRVGGKNATKRTPESLIPSSVSRRAMIGLGITAAILEVATMVPHLSAIGLLVTSNVAPGLQITV
ncbi:MAG: GAP family protein, partial [Thermomicrobiales bacterium]